MSIVDKEKLLSYAEKSPPISKFLKEQEIELPSHAQSIAHLSSKQRVWRDEFEHYIKENINSICVVGNSASLLNKSLGKEIDKHNLIIRFNNYCSDPNLQKQCGKSLNIWVKAPDFKEQDKPLTNKVAWAIITGPDILYTMSDWSNAKLTLDEGGKLITPPLEVWQNLVKILKAPPSAGLLVIMWIIQITGKADSLSVVGFQSLTEKEQEQYHHSSSAHKAGERHNWQGEKKLLQTWQKEGLNFLDKENA